MKIPGPCACAIEITIDVLHRALNRSKVDRSDKIAAFKRLSRFGSPVK